MSLIARGVRAALRATASMFARPSEPTCDALAQAAGRAACALAARVGPDGRLRYRESAEGGVLPGYNVVRHAGTLYALAALDTQLVSPELAAARDRASRYLETCCLHPVAVAADAQAVWSDAEGHPEYAKLGASGLALAAWVALREQGAYAPATAHLLGLGRFLLAMQDDAGLFYMRYHAVEGRLRRASLYYPGEAALGLYRLARLDPGGPWCTTADRAVAALARARQRSGAYPPDHWMLIAAAGREPEGVPANWRAPLVEALLVEADETRDELTRDARVAPTAARMEGLAGALAGTRDAAQRRRILRALARASNWLLTRQRDDGAFARGGDDTRAGELRIDTTQHALSALLDAHAAGACTPAPVKN